MLYDNNNKIETFADRLRSARKAKGLGQTELAGKVGVSSGSVGNWEIGPSQPRPETLRKVAAILEVTPAWLLYGSSTSEPHFEMKDAPSEMKRRVDESSPFGWMETSTLERMLADLSNRLQKATAGERKHIIGNIVDVALELERREMGGVSSTNTEGRAATPSPQKETAIDYVIGQLAPPDKTIPPK